MQKTGTRACRRDRFVFLLFRVFSLCLVSDRALCPGMYLYGSRLWGGASDKSDFDFLVVLRKCPPAQQHVATWTQHAGNVDALCMSEKEFEAQLAKRRFLYVVVARWIPEDWRWRQHKIPAPEAFGGGAAEARLVCEAVLNEVERDWGVAEKKANKGLVKEATKVKSHAVRMLRIAAQLKQQPSQVPDLWCTDDIVQLGREDYSGTALPLFLEEERERLTALIK